ncbi:hypothetical protein CEXT_558131 [Caerostris extrusa]|uniref:Uncharacterized protein n=1 Tax=Caerostris extrusa TaxID=172846 RepID=A0AAV4WCS3_CAEEX|nr:hypothetical protein CEXT_558131 [Caerostris extrusa]
MCQGSLLIYSDSDSSLIGGNAARPNHGNGIVAGDLTLDIGLGKSWFLVCFCMHPAYEARTQDPQLGQSLPGPSDRASEAGCLFEQNGGKSSVANISACRLGYSDYNWTKKQP